jgi:uncharacterized damage-inducible protein DinB
MIDTGYIRTMAGYNRWQNQSLYRAADTLNDSDRTLDKGAFFGSVQATLTHLLWGDKIWMSRFTDAPAPRTKNIPASIGKVQNWASLKREQAEMDSRINAWAIAVMADDLAGDLSWFSGAAGRDISKPLSLLVIHFFNHQTHHRGQVHCLLTLLGATPDATDLFLMPDEFSLLTGG